MKSIENVSPELSSYKLGRRKSFYIPKIIPQRKKIRIYVSWLKKTLIGKKQQQKLEERFSNQIIASYYNKGNLIKKKNKIYIIYY
jgi:ribosomal protein S7